MCFAKRLGDATTINAKKRNRSKKASVQQACNSEREKENHGF
jgi:hypothetical protein